MKYNKTNNTIETERLLLRKFVLDDSDDLTKICNNYNIYKYTMNLPYPYEKQNAIDFINFLSENPDNNKAKVLEILRSRFRPEFINRIDEIVVFKSLSKEVVYSILDKIIHETESRLTDINLRIQLTDKAKDFIIDASYEESFGARPIKRYVTHNIETLLANRLIKDEIKRNSTIIIDVLNNELIIKD